MKLPRVSHIALNTGQDCEFFSYRDNDWCQRRASYLVNGGSFGCTGHALNAAKIMFWGIVHLRKNP